MNMTDRIKKELFYNYTEYVNGGSLESIIKWSSLLYVYTGITFPYHETQILLDSIKDKMDSGYSFEEALHINTDFFH